MWNTYDIWNFQLWQRVDMQERESEKRFTLPKKDLYIQGFLNYLYPATVL